MPVKWTLGALAVLVIAAAALANGLPGQRLEKVVGNMIVDVGTDQTTAPIAGSTVEFDFALLDSSSRDPLPTTNVGVNIAHNGQMMVNCDLMVDPQMTFVYYTFPEPGTYTLKVEFFNTRREPLQQKLASASFPIQIGSHGLTRFAYIGGFVGTFVAGLAAGYWGKRARVRA
jgi:hypothetical protein